jgi:hypothetical protein
LEVFRVAAAAAFVVAMNTLEYMRGRDLELGLRNGWIEIHKAMVELRVRRELVLLQNKMAQYSLSIPAQPQDDSASPPLKVNSSIKFICFLFHY